MQITSTFREYVEPQWNVLTHRVQQAFSHSPLFSLLAAGTAVAACWPQPRPTPPHPRIAPTVPQLPQNHPAPSLPLFRWQQHHPFLRALLTPLAPLAQSMIWLKLYQQNRTDLLFASFSFCCFHATMIHSVLQSYHFQFSSDMTIAFVEPTHHFFYLLLHNIPNASAGFPQHVPFYIKQILFIANHQGYSQILGWLPQQPLANPSTSTAQHLHLAQRIRDIIFLIGIWKIASHCLLVEDLPLFTFAWCVEIYLSFRQPLTHHTSSFFALSRLHFLIARPHLEKNLTVAQPNHVLQHANNICTQSLGGLSVLALFSWYAIQFTSSTPTRGQVSLHHMMASCHRLFQQHKMIMLCMSCFTLGYLWIQTYPQTTIEVV